MTPDCRSTGRPGFRRSPPRAVALAALAVLTVGCASGVPGPAAAPPPATAGDAPRAERSAEPPITRAREGRPAASERVRFRPRALILERGARAPVEVASTENGELMVPDDVRHLGWWDGGAYAGDPFGSAVIAGHVDSRTQGLGFFARLLDAERGDVVTLQGDGHRLSYRITRVQSITKQTLAADGAAFDQRTGHRLVLITCTGDYVPGEGYDSNLVLYADPIGLAR